VRAPAPPPSTGDEARTALESAARHYDAVEGCDPIRPRHVAAFLRSLAASPSPRAQTGTPDGVCYAKTIPQAYAAGWRDSEKRAALRREERELAPYYLADGSTVMLPAAEVERLRKSAAVVIGAARRLSASLTIWHQDGAYEAYSREHQVLMAALDALAALSSPATNPEPETKKG
jgi:hypothetical protein